jgi:hypothetical protein
VARLLACPFCRDLHAAGETDGTCPVCGVALQAMEKLPPSFEVAQEEAAELDRIPLEDRRLPWSFVGRGRGALLGLSALGLFAFFMPWVVMTKPELAALSGFDLARGRAGWLWGGAVGWFMMLPLVWTRRTIMQMRGVRIITALFAALTLGEVLMLLALPPQGGGRVPIAFSWGWGLQASLAISVLAVFCAARLGGRIDDLSRTLASDPTVPSSPTAAPPQTLH